MTTSLAHRLRDRLADASIYFSFDRSGFERHARRFEPDDLDVDLAGRRILVTGANSGLGRSAAMALAQLGAEVWLLCRDPERGRKALDDLRFASRNETLRLELIDLASLPSIRAFADRLGDLPVHGVIHNAGVLPDRRQLTTDGLELTWATNVVGPFLLTWLLLPSLSKGAKDGGGEGARVINVTSGGMYTQRLSLEDPGWQRCEPPPEGRGKPFDGVVAYAQTKRAEVILTELWAERLGGTGITVNSMHPGWADTPAVRQALPRFHAFTRKRLRSPRQGADTMVWLAACRRIARTHGKLFFDRQEAPTHLLSFTRESDGERSALWQLCREQAGLRDTEGWMPDAFPSAPDPTRNPDETDRLARILEESA